MRKYAAMLTLLLLPSLALAQGRRGGRGMGPDAMQRNVIQVMIEHKTELSLTNDQIAKLEPIGKKLEEQNKPILEEMLKLRQSGGNARDITEEQRQQMRTQMEKVQENREAALKDARDVLTEEQLSKLREVMRDMRPRRGGRRGTRG